jgi:hypothetical protein
MIFEPQRNHSALVYRGQDNLVHYFYVPPGSGWTHDGGSFSASPVYGSISLSFSTTFKHTSIAYCGQFAPVFYWVP